MSAQPDTLPRQRALLYVFTGLLLLVCRFMLQDIHWLGSMHLHTLMEVVATLLASFVGAMSLVRFFSQRDAQFLYIGAGFLGTALLDGYHALVTSWWFQPYMPSDMPHLIPWSWMASRLFLSLLMFVSWLLWYMHRNTGYTPKVSRVFWVTALATLSCFVLFSLAPLPNYGLKIYSLHRPFEWGPALFFGLALYGYLTKGAWRHEVFEHWLILSLIVGLATQVAFMPYSDQLYDTEFNVAHLLKKASYIAVLTGLLISLYLTYQELKAETQKRTQAEQTALKQAEALRKSESWFRAIANHTHDWEYWMGPDGKMLFVSPSCERITGYSAEAFLSGRLSIGKIISDKESPATIQHFDEPDRHDRVHDFDFRIIASTGEERWLNHVCLAIYDENGQFIGRRASNRDITERKLAEFETLTLSKALHHSPAAVLITNARGEIEYTNPKFTEITGYSAEEVLGKNPRLLKSGKHDEAFYQQMWKTMQTGATWTGEIINKRRNGEMYWESTSISPILDDRQNIKRYVAVKQEITAQKQLEATLYHQANFDVLTGLANRNLFHDRLEHALKQAARNDALLALMMLDLDYFKEVNDSLGHDAGDELLKQVAERMLACVRHFDTVGRMGGDEFMLLIEGFTESAIPKEIAEHLLRELAKPYRIFGSESLISASIGVAFSAPQAMDLETLKKQADIALYQAKERGRNRVVYFQP